jgi:hypothetical protein
MTATLEQVQSTYKNLGVMNSWDENPEEFQNMISQKWQRRTVYTGATYETEACHENKTFWKVYTA